MRAVIDDDGFDRMREQGDQNRVGARGEAAKGNNPRRQKANRRH